MQVLTLSTISVVVVILLYSPVASSENIQPAAKISRRYIHESPSYSNLLSLLKSRERQFNQREDIGEVNDENDETGDENNELGDENNELGDEINELGDKITNGKRKLPDDLLRGKEATFQRFFLSPVDRASRRTRPSYGYGKKPHWDTFFGKK
ncbi:unnamed protein product [Rotaria socialis]|uniref:Uncharacterized protein n=1 Tax=Rotaria socialis TaxID=392032 RepID=A0A818GUM0_9BILA|nr:unnamed protein product [Rotaria socialis]CAF3497628.1 unnamed protein product [Rotaria socialis]CAF3593482.1 unnamed protein product [Rotaria socialis]CAF4388394.1 unnamed protein product [Rotaria socialis]CAF4494273.1 unnamed protein product [Rotaria socialis]